MIVSGEPTLLELENQAIFALNAAADLRSCGCPVVEYLDALRPVASNLLAAALKAHKYEPANFMDSIARESLVVKDVALLEKDVRRNVLIASWHRDSDTYLATLKSAMVALISAATMYERQERPRTERGKQ